MNVSDQRLIAQLSAGGGENIFGLLVARYQRQVRTTLYRLTGGNTALTDDLAQETFLQANLRIKTFKGRGSFGGWLSKIAYHIFLQHLRKEKKHEPLDDNVPNDSGIPVSDQVQIKIDIERAMLDLSLPERMAIDLCLANGYSHSEACEIMDIPLGTLKSHILRGKEKLKANLHGRR